MGVEVTSTTIDLEEKIKLLEKENRKLKQSLINFNSLKADNNSPIFQINSKGKLLYANTTSNPILSKLKLTTKNTLSGVWIKVISKALATGMPKEFELNAGNKIFDLRIVPNSEYGFVNIYGTNITKRKRVEIELKESEQRYKGIVDDQTEMICRFLPNGTINFANNAYCIYLNDEREKLIGKNIFEFMPIRHMKKFKQRLISLTKEQPVVSYSQKINPKGTGQKWQLWTDRAIFNENGRIVEYQSVGQDITAMKEAEQTIFKSEQYLRQVADANPSLIYVSNALGEIQFANKSFNNFCGYEFDEIIGKNKSELVKGNELHKKIKKEDEAVITKGKNIYIPEQYVESVKSSKKSWFQAVKTRIKSLDGKSYQILGVATKIDQLKKAQDDLENQTIELQRSNKDLEMFAYAASHDLQEPIRTVSSYIHLLEKKLGDNLTEDMSLFMFYATDGVKRMQHLINDLLEYSRIGTKKNAIEEVDVTKAIMLAKSNLSSLIKNTQAEIVVSQMPKIIADKSQLISLFQNLIENAIKFRKETEKPLVKITCKKFKTKTQFVVKDNGIGINDKYYDKIFTIFQRLNSRSEHDGTGIGLAICKKIVESFGGKIWVKSEFGKGTSFIFEIKLKKKIE